MHTILEQPIKLTSLDAVQGCFGQEIRDHGGKLGLSLFHFSANASAATENSLNERVPSQDEISMIDLQQ